MDKIFFSGEFGFQWKYKKKERKESETNLSIPYLNPDLSVFLSDESNLDSPWQ
jgi:hypothetical protein